jgi:chaperonin GroES
MATHFKVMGPRALVKRLENTLQSSKIEIIQYQAEPSQFAVVLAVGPGDRLDNGTVKPMEVKQNDVVVLKKLCGAPVFVNGEACALVMRDDLLAVIDL